MLAGTSPLSATLPLRSLRTGGYRSSTPATRGGQPEGGEGGEGRGAHRLDLACASEVAELYGDGAAQASVLQSHRAAVVRVGAVEVVAAPSEHTAHACIAQRRWNSGVARLAVACEDEKVGSCIRYTINWHTRARAHTHEGAPRHTPACAHMCLCVRV